MTESTESMIIEDKKPIKEVPVVKDQGFFQHDTGDTYEGFFEAKKKERNVKMNGPGVYTTAEGEVYSGSWDADKLGANDKTIITFPDGSKYEGFFKEWAYSGRAKYTYPDGSILESDFADSSPIGQLVLTDPNGQMWLGHAEQGYGWLEPVNHFYEMLEKTRETVKRSRRSNKNITK